MRSSLTLLVLVACLGACNSRTSSGPRVVAGTGSVSSIRYQQLEQRNHAFVLVRAGHPLNECVDLSLFGKFKVGMTFDQAEEQFGPPKSRESGTTRELAVYELPTARVAVARDLWRDSTVVSKWALYAYPKEEGTSFPIRHILRPVVLSQIASPSAEYTLVIQSEDNEAPSVWCEITASGVKSVRLIGP